MTLFATLSTAMTGLSVAQHALNVTANNVANANTDGYSRKIVEQEAVIIAGRGAGARAADPARAVDDFLTVRAREQQGKLARSEVLAEVHERIQDQLFGAPGDADRGLPGRIARLASAAEAMANSPGKAASALAFIGAVQDLTREIGAAGSAVQGLRHELDQEIAATVGAINGDLKALHELNREIVRAAPTAELLDRQDALLDRLAAKLDVSVFRHDNGTVSVHARGGQALLEGKPSYLAYEPAAQVVPETSFGAIRLVRADEVDPATLKPLAAATGEVLVSGGIRAELTPELLADAVPDAAQTVISPLQAGKLQGLLEARDRILPALADQVGELAGLVRYTLNAAHNAGTPQPPPNQLVGTRTDFGGSAVPMGTGTAYLAVVNKATGATERTISVNLSTGGPAAIIGQLNTDLGGLGTAALNADGALQITLGSGYGIALNEGDSAVTVADTAGHTRSYGLAHYFGLNDLVVADGAQPSQLAVRKDLLQDSRLLSQAMLDVTPGAVPTSRLGGAGDNRGAQRLAAALDGSATAVARGALPAGSYRLADYAAEMVAATAVQVDRAKSTAANDAALAEDLDYRRAAVSGVNLDEELSKLVLYQQAYNVSARLVAITNDLFDELLSISR